MFDDIFSTVGDWFGSEIGLPPGITDIITDEIFGGNGNGGGVFSEEFPDVGDIGDMVPVAMPGGGRGTRGMNGHAGNGGGMVQVGLPGIIGGVATAGALAMSLGSRLRAMFGAAGPMFSINGIKGKLSSLWPYVQKYGMTAVASALGITVGALGTLLAQAPKHAPRRRRGISARDMRTTKRVVNFTNRMAEQIGCVRRPSFARARRGHGHRVINV